MTGLSITTVSHAINGTRKVSAKSKMLVDQAIKETGYKPNLAAQMMKTQRSKTIALIIPATEPNNSTNCFYFDVLNGAKVFLENNGYDLIVSTYPEDHPEYDLCHMQVLQRRWVDGILLVPPSNDYAAIRGVQELNLPVVLLDRWVEGCTLPVVCSDNKGISIEAVILLANAGKKRIAYLGSNLDASTAKDRYQGYCEAMSRLGREIDPKMVKNGLKYTVADGYRATHELVVNGADAIFAANSVLTIGMLKKIKELKIRVPQEVALIGFDDYEWTEITEPPLTSVTQDADQMGRVGSEILLNILEGREGTKTSVIIPARISVRGSHGG